jgi:hypothetical protein
MNENYGTYGGGTARLVVHEDAHVQARISLKKIAMGTVTVSVSEKVKEARMREGKRLSEPNQSARKRKEECRLLN